MVLSTMGLVTPTAQAVTLGSLVTRMEIDGNKANAAGFDWNDIQDGTLPGGYVISPNVVSAGVVAQTYQIDGPSITQSCGVQDANSAGRRLQARPEPLARPVGPAELEERHLLRWRRGRGGQRQWRGALHPLRVLHTHTVRHG